MRARLVELEQIHIAVQSVDGDMGPGAAIGGPDHYDLMAMRHRRQDLGRCVGLHTNIAVVGT